MGICAVWGNGNSGQGASLKAESVWGFPFSKVPTPDPFLSVEKSGLYFRAIEKPSDLPFLYTQ